MPRILGCDPGLTGAVALWDTETGTLDIRDAPTAQIAVGTSKARTVYLDAAYAHLILDLRPDLAILEQVNGVRGQSASASFSFGAGFGLLRGILAALDVPLHYAAPNAWRVKLRVPPGKDGSRLRAAQIYPRYAELFRLKKHDGRADAALIARYPL